MMFLHSHHAWLMAISCLSFTLTLTPTYFLVAQGPAASKQAAGPGAGGMAIYGGYGSETGSQSLKFMILEEESEAGNERMKVRTASRVKTFSYQLASFKPQEVDAGYGGGGMMGPGMYPGGGGYGGEAAGYGGDAGYGMGMMGGYGSEGGYGTGMMGGPGMGGPGAMHSMPRQPTITIYVYVFDNDQENNRTKIELLTPPRPKTAKSQSAGETPGNPGDGMDMGAMVGDDMGMANIPRFVRLASLVGPPQEPLDKYRLTQSEYAIVANTIKQQIWKADAVKQLNAKQGNAAETEQLLKQLLTEEYETQLARQEMEVESIQQRIIQLKEEIARRRSAKDRVIDVQLGRIVLEAQGLLGK